MMIHACELEMVMPGVLRSNHTQPLVPTFTVVVEIASP